MRALKVFSVLLLVASAAAAGWFGLKVYQEARASDLSSVLEAETQPPIPAPPPIEREIDARIASYKDRGDGARLVWAPMEDERALRVAFIDNSTLVISATTSRKGASYRIFTFDVASGETMTDYEKDAPAVASSHRPANKNAGVLCRSERVEDFKDEIFCSDLTGGKTRRLTTHDGGEDLIEPAVSPDGAWVLFEVNMDRLAVRRKETGASPVKSDHGASTIWKIGLNGAGLQQLTRGADDRFPAWSEDGRLIYFQRRAKEGSWDAYVMHADGTNPAPLLRTYDANEHWPSKLPGTEEALYVAEDGDGNARLRRLHLDTKSGRWITSGAYGRESHPSVSPDGKLASFLAPVDLARPERLGVWLTELLERD